MSSSSVWVQLYYELEKKGSPEQIYESDLKPGQDWNVASFRELVKAKRQVDLNHCDPARLVVYPPHTVPPFSEQTFIRGDKILTELIDELGNTNPGVSIGYDHPLIVVAPAPAPHPPGQDANLKEEIRAVEKRLNAALMKDSFAVSYSNYYDEKRKESRIENWQTQESQNNLCKDLLAAERETGPEKKKVKPFWQKFIEDDKKSIIPGIKNGYETANLGPKTPDICFYKMPVDVPTAESFVAAGDCKGEGWKGTSGAEKGQIMLYLHKMLEAQPNRQFAYGFVTNNKSIILVKATRAIVSPFQVMWSISEVLDYRNGMQLFVDFMEEDDGYRLNPQFNDNPVSIDKQLRPGGTCRAYGGRFQGKLVVAKVYSSKELARKNYTNMNTINNSLASSNKGGAVLPNSCGLSQNWLLVEPKGEPFTETSFSGLHLESVLVTLRGTHEKGFVHRDVRMANMFDLGGGKVLLNDWGSLVQANMQTPHEGCPEPFMHPSLHGQEGKSVPLPSHDLYSLVYSIAMLVAPGFNADAIKTVFIDSFAAADDLDYDCVGQSLKAFLVS